MFQIFSKKHFILDAMVDMPDIHCHVLPGIDDGAANLDTSKALLQKYVDLGFRKVIATPHTLEGLYPNTPKSIALSFAQIDGFLPELALSYASEYMLDDQFEKLLDEDNILCLKENYVLIEMSYFQPPMNLEELLFKITAKGLIPILAHPERYAFYHRDLDIFKKLKAGGCLLQMNALSASSHYGVNVQKAAFKLLEKGMYDFIGTDTHRLAHLEKISEITLQDRYYRHLSSICRNNTIVFS